MITQIINRIKTDEILKKISDDYNNEIYIVGGSVRDFAMGKETLDRDLIVIDEHAKDFALKLSNAFSATFVPMDEINNIYRIVLPDKVNYIDITNPVQNSLNVDLARRDLTINSVAVNLKNFEVVDNFNGLDDIKNGVLREISEQNFVDDSLRLLRIFRFEAVLGFELSVNLQEIVKKHHALISLPAMERINCEILKLFGGEYAHKALIDMDNCGLLEDIFPFISELKRVPSNSHHHLDLFYHSIETANQVQILYQNSSSEVKEHLDSVAFGQLPRLAHLKLAAFLHDIGKYSTWTIEEDTGRQRFIKHDDVGAKMSISILKKMKFSTKQIDYISSMIKSHIYPSHVIVAPELNEKVMMRFVRKMDKNAIDVIILAMADRLSARGPEITDEIIHQNISGLNKLLNFYLSVKETLEPLPKLLSGNEIMEILDLKPSPKLGKIVNALHEAQLSGDVITKEHAIEFIEQFR